MLILTVLYVALCALTAYVGRSRTFGFWGYFVASLIVSPVIGMVLVLASASRPPHPLPPAEPTDKPPP